MPHSSGSARSYGPLHERDSTCSLNKTFNFSAHVGPWTVNEVCSIWKARRVAIHGVTYMLFFLSYSNVVNCSWVSGNDVKVRECWRSRFSTEIHLQSHCPSNTLYLHKDGFYRHMWNRHHQKMWRFSSEIILSPQDISCQSTSVLTSQWILVFPFKNSDRQRKSNWWMSIDMDSPAMHYHHKHSYSCPLKVLVHACIPGYFSFRLVWYGVIQECELLAHIVRCVSRNLTRQKN